VKCACEAQERERGREKECVCVSEGVSDKSSRALLGTVQRGTGMSELSSSILTRLGWAQVVVGLGTTLACDQ